MPWLQDVSGALKIGMVLSPFALALTLIGMASPYWVEQPGDEYSHKGLWKGCTGSKIAPKKCSRFPSGGYSGSPYFEDPLATQAMEVLGLLIGGAAVTTVFLCAFVEAVKKQKVARVMGMILNFAAAGFVLVGAFIYTAEFNDFISKLLNEINYIRVIQSAQNQGYAVTSIMYPAFSVNMHLSWAYGLCMVGGGIFLITGFILIKNL